MHVEEILAEAQASLSAAEVLTSTARHAADEATRVRELGAAKHAFARYQALIDAVRASAPKSGQAAG